MSPPGQAAARGIAQQPVGGKPAAAGPAIRKPTASKAVPRPGAQGAAPAAAGPPRGWGVLSPSEASARVKQLQNMGFNEADARSALAAHKWEVNAALDGLLTGAFSSGADAETASSSDTGASTDVPRSEACPAGADVETASSPAGSCFSSDAGASTGEAANVSMSSSLVSSVDVGTPAPQSFSDASVSDVSSAQVESNEVVQIDDAALDQGPRVVQADREEDASVLNPVRTEVPVEVAPAPQKELMKVTASWNEDDSSDKLGVQKDTLVFAWIDTKSENGWIYAELIDNSQAGWLPSVVLESAPQGQRYMTAIYSCQGSSSDSELSLEVGCTYQVHVESRTPLGWAYAQVLFGTNPQQEATSVVQEGWVPDYCFNWSVL